MLEHAASCFASFRASYEECGKDVGALVAKAMEPLEAYLPSLAASATVQQLRSELCAAKDDVHAAQEEARAAQEEARAAQAEARAARATVLHWSSR